MTPERYAVKPIETPWGFMFAIHDDKRHKDFGLFHAEYEVYQMVKRANRNNQAVRGVQ